MSTKERGARALAGGWPGAFLAQRALRHKTAKPSYQIVFWAIVALHQAAAADFLRNWAAVRKIWTWVAG